MGNYDSITEENIFYKFHEKAIEKDDVDLAKRVTKNNVQWLGVTTSFPLHHSVKLGDINILKFLISDAGCDKEAKDDNSRKPLHIACEFTDNVELVRYLVEVAGCDINAKGPTSSTSLHIACKRKQLKIIRFLTSKTNCNREADDKYGQKPLYLACAHSCNIDIIRHLVEVAGCDINATGQNGYTSLHIACVKKELEIVRYLTAQRNCNIEAEDNDGNKPLHLACSYQGNVKVVKHLVEIAGCDVNAKELN